MLVLKKQLGNSKCVKNMGIVPQAVLSLTLSDPSAKDTENLEKQKSKGSEMKRAVFWVHIF